MAQFEQSGMYLAAVAAFFFEIGLRRVRVPIDLGGVDYGCGKGGLRPGEGGFKVFSSGCHLWTLSAALSCVDGD